MLASLAPDDNFVICLSSKVFHDTTILCTSQPVDGQVCSQPRWDSTQCISGLAVEKFLVRQFDSSFLDVTAYFGLAAAGFMTVNLLLGLLVSVQYSPIKPWPRKRIPISRIHN